MKVNKIFLTCRDLNPYMLKIWFNYYKQVIG
nr:MAG TPA: hypothetical protein [Bacteriophage sp.]